MKLRSTNHAKMASFDNIKESLVELMAEYLDSDDLELDMLIGLIEDPEEREDSELHIRMAEAAFLEFKKTVIDVKNYE